MHPNNQNKSGFHMSGLQRPKQDLLGKQRELSPILHTQAPSGGVLV